MVDATGRRSSLDRWLAAIGSQPTATQAAECGLAYYSRHYRLRTSAGLPGPVTTRIVAGLDEFTVGIWGGDNATMLLCIAPLAEDKRFRGVRDPGIFTRVLRTVPAYAAWLDVLEPTSPVFPMGGLHNTLRRLVVGGSPVATGLHAVGDNVCTTNPTLGRGLSLAIQGAADLVDALDRYGGHRTDLALALDERAGDHIAPFYADQAGIDAARLAALRHAISGTALPAAPAVRDGSPSASCAVPHRTTRWSSGHFWRSWGCPAGRGTSTPTRPSWPGPARSSATAAAPPR